MPLIEWATPMLNRVAAVRLLQNAANMLDVNEWCAAMHWPRDEYSEAKFRDMQEIGRLLARFDDGVLDHSMAAYEQQLAGRAQSRGASQAVPKPQHGCCERAELVQCVCYEASACPEHGVRHIGSHD